MNSKAGANWSNGLTMSKQWESPMACSSLFNTIGSSSATTQMVLFGCFMIWSTKHDEALPQGRLKKHAKVRKKFGIRELPCGGGEGKVSGKNGAFGTWKEALVGWFVNRS